MSRKYIHYYLIDKMQIWQCGYNFTRERCHFRSGKQQRRTKAQDTVNRPSCNQFAKTCKCKLNIFHKRWKGKFVYTKKQEDAVRNFPPTKANWCNIEYWIKKKSEEIVVLYLKWTYMQRDFYPRHANSVQKLSGNSFGSETHRKYCLYQCFCLIIKTCPLE